MSLHNLLTVNRSKHSYRSKLGMLTPGSRGMFMSGRSGENLNIENGKIIGGSEFFLDKSSIREDLEELNSDSDNKRMNYLGMQESNNRGEDKDDGETIVIVLSDQVVLKTLIFDCLEKAGIELKNCFFRSKVDQVLMTLDNGAKR